MSYDVSILSSRFVKTIPFFLQKIFFGLLLFFLAGEILTPLPLGVSFFFDMGVFTHSWNVFSLLVAYFLGVLCLATSVLLWGVYSIIYAYALYGWSLDACVLGAMFLFLPFFSNRLSISHGHPRSYVYGGILSILWGVILLPSYLSLETIISWYTVLASICIYFMHMQELHKEISFFVFATFILSRFTILSLQGVTDFLQSASNLSF